MICDGRRPLALVLLVLNVDVVFDDLVVMGVLLAVDPRALTLLTSAGPGRVDNRLVDQERSPLRGVFAIERIVAGLQIVKRDFGDNSLNEQ